MSNYYVSKCCDAEAKYVSSGEKEAMGQCTKCGEMSELISIIE